MKVTILNDVLKTIRIVEWDGTPSRDEGIYLDEVPYDIARMCFFVRTGSTEVEAILRLNKGIYCTRPLPDTSEYTYEGLGENPKTRIDMIDLEE